MLKAANISPLKQEIFGLKSQLASVSAERNLLQDALRKIQSRMSHDVESSLSRQAQNYELRLTELHSVIAELKKQLEVQREKIIPEESTEDEENEGDHEEQKEDPERLPTPVSTLTTSTSSPRSPSPSSPSEGNLQATGDGGCDDAPTSTSNGVEDAECGEENKDKESEDGSVKMKEECNRRISVSRSRRRILQTCNPVPNPTPPPTPSPTSNNNGSSNIHNNKPVETSMESGRHHIKSDKPLPRALKLEDLEMSSWRQEKGEEGSKAPLRNSKCSLIQHEPGKKREDGGGEKKDKKYGKEKKAECNVRRGDIQSREESEMIPEKPRLSPDSVFQFAALRDEVAQIRQEHYAIRESLFKKEGELDRTRGALENIAQERDFLKKKVSELEYLLKQSPKKFPQFMSSHSPDMTGIPRGIDDVVTCKVAERVKLSQCRLIQNQNLNQTKRNNNNNNNLNNNCHHHHHHQSIHLNMVQLQSPQNQQQHPQQPGSPVHHGQTKMGKNHNNNNNCNVHHKSNFITGQELVAIGSTCSTRMVEHLVQPLQDESTVKEMEQTLALSTNLSTNCQDETMAAIAGSMVQDKIHEFEIETERLNSRLEHLRSQNDVLTLNLEDAKSYSDRLTVLLGKYESNNVGHQIALSFSDQLIEAYDVLVALLESELGLLLANCRAAGIGSSNTSNTTSSSSTTTTNGNASQSEDDIDVASLLQRANENRMTAEIAARSLIIRMVDSPGSENNNGMMLHLPVPYPHPPPPPHSNLHLVHNNCMPPWEDERSSCSHTLSSASSLGEGSNHSQHSHDRGSSGAGGGESRSGSIEKNEEQRVRDLIIQLKTDREAVRNTVMELENWSVEPMSPVRPTLSPCDILEARKLDLETAVLMQELMAMREDRAELRAQLFLLEKEKASLEFKLDSFEAQGEAYKARINHLKAEISDMQEASTLQIGEAQNLNQNTTQQQQDGNANNNNAIVNKNTTINEEREIILKKRIQDLATSLEKVTHNANLRDQQSNEMTNDLKKANGILIEQLEGVKKKYQSRVKKMEEQIFCIMERHSLQMKLYKERVQILEIEMMERSQHL